MEKSKHYTHDCCCNTSSEKSSEKPCKKHKCRTVCVDLDIKINVLKVSTHYECQKSDPTTTITYQLILENNSDHTIKGLQIYESSAFLAKKVFLESIYFEAFESATCKNIKLKGCHKSKPGNILDKCRSYLKPCSCCDLIYNVRLSGDQTKVRHHEHFKTSVRVTGYVKEDCGEFVKIVPVCTSSDVVYETEGSQPDARRSSVKHGGSPHPVVFAVPTPVNGQITD